jgi:hypothetical protein
MAVAMSKWDMKTNKSWARLDGWRRPMSVSLVCRHTQNRAESELAIPLDQSLSTKCGNHGWWISAHEPQYVLIHAL